LAGRTVLMFPSMNNNSSLANEPTKGKMRRDLRWGRSLDSPPPTSPCPTPYAPFKAEIQGRFILYVKGVVLYIDVIRLPFFLILILLLQCKCPVPLSSFGHLYQNVNSVKVTTV
jgi:hypothetical protein